MFPSFRRSINIRNVTKSSAETHSVTNTTQELSCWESWPSRRLRLSAHRGVTKGWPGWPKPPQSPLWKKYKAKTTYSIYNIQWHIKLHLLYIYICHETGIRDQNNEYARPTELQLEINRPNENDTNYASSQRQCQHHDVLTFHKRSQ